MSRKNKRNSNQTPAPVPPVPPDLAQQKDSSLAPVAQGILDAPTAPVPTRTVAFLRLYTNDDNTYCAEGDDGATWTFSPDGEEWDVRNDLPRPESARPMDAKAWDAAGLPLTLDVNMPEVDADIDVRNPVEAAPVDAAPDAAPAPATEDEGEEEVVPPLPEGVVVPKAPGFRRIGTTVPFVVVPCALVAPAIRIRKRAGGSPVKYVRENVSAVETAIPGTNDKTEKVVTKTTRIIDAVEEHRAVDSDRGRMRNKILDLCTPTCIGWLCPRDREGDLRKRVAEVQQEIQTINEGLAVYKLTDGCVVAIIETDADVAAKTIRDTLKDAMDNLREAFAAGDYETMRTIATGLKGFDALVNEEAAQKIEEAIAEARRIARVIKRQTEVKARKLEDVQKELSLDAIDAARFMLIAQEREVRDEGEALPEVDARNVDGVEGEDEGSAGEEAVAASESAPQDDGDDSGAVA